MAPHSSTLAWKIPWAEEPGGLLSIELHRVGHDWSDLAEAVAATYYLGQNNNFIDMRKSNIKVNSFIIKLSLCTNLALL